MKRTVKEWAEFLNMDENQKFGLESKGGIKIRIKDYKSFTEFINHYDEWWLGQPVIKAYVDNLPNYHLLIIPMD